MTRCIYTSTPVKPDGTWLFIVTFQDVETREIRKMLVSHTKDITAAQKKMNTTVRPCADTYVHVHGCVVCMYIVRFLVIHEYLISVGDRIGPEKS